MTEKQLKLSAVLLKVYFLSDIIEAELTALNPIRNITEQNMMMILERLKKVCTEYRKMYENVDSDSSEIIGELSDLIDNEIIKLLK